MKIKALIVTIEDASYTRQKGDKIAQSRLTCLDQDGPVCLKDTFDATIPAEDVSLLGESPCGRQITLLVSELRPMMNGGTRMRFSARVSTLPGDLTNKPSK